MGCFHHEWCFAVIFHHESAARVVKKERKITLCQRSVINGGRKIKKIHTDTDRRDTIRTVHAQDPIPSPASVACLCLPGAGVQVWPAGGKPLGLLVRGAQSNILCLLEELPQV
jgi:hypothetical protein